MAYIHQGPELALNKDKTKVVPADSPEAAFVLVATGGTLSDEEAARWGLTDKPAEKARADESEDKAKKGSRQNKGG